MRSMTGFGRGEAAANGWKIEIELSAVNRKQSDINVNLPGSLIELEAEVRRLIGEAISRGRVNAKINLNREGGSTTQLSFDEELASQYVDAVKAFAEKRGLETHVEAAELFRAPGVFKLDDARVSADEVKDCIFPALAESISQLIQMQEEEGAHLHDDLCSRISQIETSVAVVKEFAPTIPDTYRKTLLKRLNESGIDCDFSDDRILREIALFAERCDITEELTRIDHHVAQFRKYFESDEPTGRPLDFLCQELNRELNTIGSKANHPGIAQEIVNAKTELEKFREQVQNVQ